MNPRISTAIRYHDRDNDVARLIRGHRQGTIPRQAHEIIVIQTAIAPSVSEHERGLNVVT